MNDLLNLTYLTYLPIHHPYPRSFLSPGLHHHRELPKHNPNPTQPDSPTHQLTPSFPGFHPAAAAGVEAANAVFYFSAFVYLAVFLNRLLFCRGNVCGSARAAAVFGAFEFVLWSATAALAGRELLRSSGSGSGDDGAAKSEEKSEKPARSPGKFAFSLPFPLRRGAAAAKYDGATKEKKNEAAAAEEGAAGAASGA